MPTRMMSIDSSTRKTGLACFIDGKLKKYKLIDLSKSHSDTDNRISEMGKQILSSLDEFNPSIVYIETPKGSGRNVELVRKLSEILGVVRGWTITHGAYYEEVMPSVWRKYCGIDQGNKTREQLKQASMDYVRSVFQISVNDDVSDSICIGIAMFNKYKE